MINKYDIYKSSGISKEVFEFGESVLEDLKEDFDHYDMMAEYIVEQAQDLSFMHTKSEL